MESYGPRHLHLAGPEDFMGDSRVTQPYEPLRYEPRERRSTPFDHLLEYVGTATALMALDCEPLPDEPFDWSLVPDEDRPYVAEVLALSDRYCEEELDTEYRTITRRILARAAARDAKCLRRKAKPERLAAGLVWLAGRGNGEFGRRGMRTSGRLWAWFGVSDCGDRGRTLQRAAGLEADDMYYSGYSSYDVIALGDPAVLHSRRRAELIAQRDLTIKIVEERRRWSPIGDGHARVKASPVKALVAAKGVDGTRSMVVLGLGEELDDAMFFALSVPDARDLVGKLDAALNAPPPRAAGN